MQQGELMTANEVADRLKVTPGRVRQLAQDGILPGVKIGRDWVFMRSEVEDYALRRVRRGRPRKT